MQWLQPLREIVALLCIVVVCLLWRYTTGPAEAVAKPPQSAALTAGLKTPSNSGAQAVPIDKMMAMVNGTEISQNRLTAECLNRHGAVVLETLVNKKIIEEACVQQGVTVTPQDVDADIDAMARRFNVPRDKWIELIQRERSISPEQYAEEIVWPMVALRRLAHASLEPTVDEIKRAFENQFGPAVKARIIVVRSQQEAEQIRQQSLAATDDFGALARRLSVDVGSASANGWVQPIRRHSGDEQFEQVAFKLPLGGISTVVRVADQFIVIKCEGHLPAAEVKLEDVRTQLAEEIRERKSRTESSALFRKLQDAATVENILNDRVKSAASPGVAAVVNGKPIAIEAVQNVCVKRHGKDTLDILITRALIEQALNRERQKIGQADIDAEIARAAESMGFQKTDGSTDIAAWLERVTRDEKMPMRHYIEDIVQPTVALKKLVGKVPVTKEDLNKAFEATFGVRSKCRIVILDNQRRAQEVWQIARQNPSAERIGDLAEKYSVDPTSKTLRGEVPPIQRHGGQPALEREAFALKPGELSGVVQVADRFMVLFCEGFTEAAKVTLAEVHDELYADIFEKKQRIEMSRYFSHLREGATIDNFLAGTSQSPVEADRLRAGGRAKSTLSQSDAAELALPRSGSLKAAAGTKIQPENGSGVLPTSFNAPITPAPR